MTNLDPIEIAKALIRCPSVTPEEAGALDYLETVLSRAGFSCHRLTFSEAGTADVDNLFARFGSGAPHLCFAGHTDVVPAGDEASWTHPPFAAITDNGTLFGRGAVDMKGEVACFTAAALSRLAAIADDFTGSISFLITGDEEGPAINGTRKVLAWMAENNHILDHCIVGEPSSTNRLGDAIKIGRRGSLNGRLTITGIQGHVAYPHLAANPLPSMLAVLAALTTHELDKGSEHFAPSNLEVTSLTTNMTASNVIPERVSAGFNIRFNDAHTGDSLQRWIRELVAAHISGERLSYDLELVTSGEAFVTSPGPLVDAMTQAISDVTGAVPELNTAGGTSDARFIKDYCPVIEFGLTNATIHQVDERVAVSDLRALTKIYQAFLDRYFNRIDISRPKSD